MTRSKIFTANNIKMQVYFITQKNQDLYPIIFIT